jgi:amino acid adenylation domain-containing protein
MYRARENVDRLAIAANQKKREKEYWLEKLSGPPPRSAFPYDHKENGTEPETKERSVSSQEIEYKWDEAFSAQLLKLAAGSDARLHMVLSAAVMGLLSRYSGNDDIVIGTPVFNPESKAKGELLNAALPLRNQIGESATFKELLLQVKDTVIEAAEHQGYPIEILVQQLDLDIQGGDFPLFDVAVVLENIQQGKDIDFYKPHVTFSFARQDNALSGRMYYDPGRYSEPFAQQVAGHFQRLLTGVVTDPDQPLSTIDILSEAERKELLETFNDTQSDYPKEKTIVQLFEEQASRTPDRTAAVGTAAARHPQRFIASGTVPVTYRELNEQSNRLAHLLRDRGVIPGTVAAILMQRSLELVVTIVAVLKAGAAYLPIDPEYPEKRICSILDDSGVTLLLTGLGVVHPLSFSGLQNQVSLEEDTDIVPYVSTPRTHIADFDSLPRPDRTLVDYSKYHRHIGIAPVKQTISLQTSRGCPYSCLYCHKIWPRKHVTRSAENIFEEIRWGYDSGVRDFVFLDDIFNLDKKNSARLLETIIKQKMDIRLYYPNGLRGDILDTEFIDLMVEAGAVNLCVALESASPRIQKLIRKNLNLERFRENIRYIAEKHPRIILEMEIMHGFPTETEEEAMMTYDFVSSIRWIHFPNLNILKIFPNTDMYRLALEHGISRKAIENSTNFAYHELPETLPVSKHFTRELQARLLEEYFLSRERMLSVLPQQMKILTEEELIQKYDSYLPMEIRRFSDILEAAGISAGEMGDVRLRSDDDLPQLSFNKDIGKYFPVQERAAGAFRLLLLDLSQFFSSESGNMLYDVVEEPLGLMYLATYLNQQLGTGIETRLFKSRIDFDSYHELKQLVQEFRPHLIGIRTLSYYRDFFHRTVSILRQWGIDVPIISGGPYATSDYTILLQDANVDLAVHGEGEHTLLDLVKRMIANNNRLPVEQELKTVPGLMFMPGKARTALRAEKRQVLILDTLEEELEQYPVTNPAAVNKSEDLLYLISTSGSTGRPKSVMMKHRSLVNLIHFQQMQTDIDFGKVLQFASIAFDVSFQEIFSTLLSGGTLHLLTDDVRSNIPLLLEFIRRHEIKTLFLPPAFLKFIFDEEEYVSRFPDSVQHIVTAGEQLVVTEPMRRYLNRNRVYLHNHYGPAETHVVTVYTMAPGDSIPDLPCIGKPISNTCIYILDAHGNLQPKGVAGELYIHGDAVGAGYHGDPQLTAQKFIIHEEHEEQEVNKSFWRSRNLFSKRFLAAGGRTYRTGDLACWLPDGNIRFLGRKDRQVQVRGFRIELDEVRAQLLELDIVKEAVVVDRRTSDGDVYLCAYIVLADKEQPFEAGEVRDRLFRVLPDYMVPSHFIPMEAMPLNASGKIDRRALPQPGLQGSTGSKPRDAMERHMVDMWREILEVHVGIDDNFFEMGGHSLKGTILISRIHKEFHVKLLLVDLFKYPTVRTLARYLREEGVERAADTFHSIQPAPPQEYYPLSPAQKRLYILQQMDRQSTVYNIPVAVTAAGELDREKLETVFRALIQRHESLRTSFVSRDKTTVQQVHDQVEFRIEPLEESIESFIRPFDLSSAPLLRVGLRQLEEQKHILVVDMHHIVSDAVTMEILIREFASLYAGEELPPLKLQYKDYSCWQNRSIETGVLEKQGRFWQEQFSGRLPVLELPTDFARPRNRGPEGDNAGIKIDEQTGSRVKELARANGVTYYQFFLAVYIVLLHKYSGQEDIIVGSPISGRQHADVQDIVGVFVNMVAIRTRPLPGKSFQEFLEEVKTAALAAHENQDYPFDEMVNRLGLQGSPGRNPVFDVGFLYNALDTKKLEATTLKIVPYELSPRVSRFDMLTAASENGGRFALDIEYSTQLFKPASIETFLRHYIDIVQQVVKEPGILLERITVAVNLKPIEAQEPQISFGF